MTQLQKLIDRIQAAPKSVRFSELERLLRFLGFARYKQRGSHVSYKNPSGKAITIVRPHGREAFCYQYDVKKVLRLLNNENN